MPSFLSNLCKPNENYDDIISSYADSVVKVSYYIIIKPGMYLMKNS